MKKPTEEFRNTRNEPGLNRDLFNEESFETLLRPFNDEVEPPTATGSATSRNRHSAYETVGTQAKDPGPSPPAEASPTRSKQNPELRQSPLDSTAKPQSVGRGNEELPLQLQTRTNRGRGIGATLVWGLGVVLMVAALGGQYAYFSRDRLALQAQWRPYLEVLCEIAGCDLPPRRELRAIELIDHAVQSHPRRDGALLIKATLLNGAEFPQPYPDVEVVMMDIEQRPVASRRFVPAEYLAGRSPDALFAAGQETHLILEVVDPGPQAVSFEFDFR
ncbi:DUF3426 domain-containing protein [Thiohalomonas denitrificans]|uniref:DUF3426 domain-containing protein n=1 Tax=Thiohalomonas denitrificans TaxID=415747 RepID=UPI0026E9A8D1|nr:DUF3426 domain-containing protein [Thiohalomonas denitrificans]